MDPAITMGSESEKLLSLKTTRPWSASMRPETTEPEILSSPVAPVLLRASAPAPVRNSLCAMLGLGLGPGFGLGSGVGLGSGLDLGSGLGLGSA